MTKREPISPQRKKIKNVKKQEGSKQALKDLPANEKARASQGGRYCATGSHYPEVNV